MTIYQQHVTTVAFASGLLSPPSIGATEYQQHAFVSDLQSPSSIGATEYRQHVATVAFVSGLLSPPSIGATEQQPQLSPDAQNIDPETAKNLAATAFARRNLPKELGGQTVSESLKKACEYKNVFENIQKLEKQEQTLKMFKQSKEYNTHNITGISFGHFPSRPLN